ncbi:MAG TPA: ROK family protein [Gaiellales bacterium]|nr:ROK family protein [Gaiellales bacterium]
MSGALPVVGIDLGGTSVKAALVSPALEILEHSAIPTDVSDQVALFEEIAGLVDRVRGSSPVAGVGFGLPSQIDQRSGTVVDSINVPLERVPFVERMRARLDLPVRIDNDANVACLAEARAGAARGRDNVVMLTLGTGVGGGLLLNGRLYRGSTGCGGELGHMVVDEHGPPCQGHCPNRGCLEVMASATGIRAAAGAIADRSPSGPLAAARAGGDDLGPRLVIERATAGDAECREALEVVGRHLGVGIASYVNIFNPELVVIGGGIVAAGELLLGPARAEAAARALRVPWSEVAVVAAQLGNEAGVVGAAALMLEPDS